MISLNTKASTRKRPWRLRAMLVALVAALLTLASATAAAQEQADQEEESIDDKLDTYWAVDRELPSLQKRIFEREGRFGLGIFAGLLSSEPFYYYYPVGLRASYFFSNHFGVEVEGSYTNIDGVLTHDTELTDFLEQRRGDSFNKPIDTEDRYLWRANALVTWHPLYGKLAFLQRKLAHFDFNLAAGGGVASVERPNDIRTEAVTEIVPQFTFGGGIQFFATTDLVVRLEGRAYLYQGATTPTNKDSFVDQLQMPTEFQLGASYMF